MSAMTENNQIVTTAEAAHILGVSEGRVRQLLNEGRIEGARHFGRDWAIPVPIKITPGAKGPEGIARLRHD